MKKLGFLPFLFVAVAGISWQPAWSQIICVTPAGAGTMNGSNWANALDGNTSAGNGYTKLAQAMKTAAAGTQFRVAEGTYLPSTDNDRGKSFEIVQDISVYGGFGGNDTTLELRNYSTHPTVFSGNIGTLTDSTDNTKIILKTLVTTTWTIFSTLDGLIISGAFNSGTGEPGCGIYNSALINIRNCTIKFNYSNNDGGGIYNNKKINVSNCILTGNRAYNGGGIYLNYSTGPSVISGCRFSANTAAHNGGAVCNSGNATMTNCLIVNNSASYGGGLYSGSTTSYNQVMSKLINTTLANNAGKDLYIFRGSNYLWNSIVWGDGLYVNTNAPLPTFDPQYSCIQGSVSGTGVINTDPSFLSPSVLNGTTGSGLTADWHVRWCSPCFNTGSNSLVPTADTTDLDGQQRIRYNSVDMGCFELDTTGLSMNKINYATGIVRIDTATSYHGGGAFWAQAVAGNLESCKYTGRNMLSEAMKDAPAGTEIWVKEGTYLASLSGNRSHSFDIGSGVKVFGGFAGNETVRDQRNPALHATILSGEIGNSGQATDNAYHVLNINPSAVFYSDSALLDGCRVEQGYANGTSGNSDGAGILVNSGTRVRMKTVTVAGNMAKGNGCGMKISSLAKVSLDSCRIENNDKITSYNGSYYNGTPGGGVYNAGKLAMAGCRVRFNDDDSEGGGIYNADSLVATGCRIDSNRQVTVRYAYGAGILNAGYALITGSTVNGNRITMYGGGIYNKTGGTLRVINTQISGNNGGWTGGGVMNEGTADLFNCDIRYNSVTTDGGGIYNKAGSVVTVCGSMIAFNTAAGAVSNTGGGGICNFGTLTINTSKICNNQTSGYGGGVYNPTWIRNSLIANNAKGGQFTTGGGVRVGAGCQGIEGSTIVNNSGQGIAATSIDNMGHEVPVADTADLFNCIVFGNDVQVTGNFNASDGCIEYGFTGTRILRDNPVFESPSGGKGPSFDGTMADWHTRPCSPCINRGNNTFLSTGDSLDAAGNSRVVETFVDLGGLEQTASQTHSINLNGNIVYVCDSAVEAGPGTSWANALSGNAPSCRYPGYSLLYEAIRDVPLSSSIWVKQGTYRACVDNDFRKFFEYGPGVKVFGGFSGSEQDLSHRIIETHPSIFTANVGNITDSTDNAFHVFYSYPSTTPWSDPALLDGLIIRDGYANYPENNGNTEKLIGAGIFNNTNARLEMRRCEVKNNYAFGKYAGNYYSGYTGGSGIYNKGTLLLKDCKVRHNINARSGAGIFSEAYLELRNSSVDSNRIQPAGTTYGYYWGGAGIYGDTGSTLVIDSCSLTRQSLPDDWAGAGIYCKGTLDLTNSSFESNRGTAVTSSGPATVYNCLFNGDGGGVLSSQSLTLLRCRFTNISFDTNYHAGCINVAGIAHIDSCEISHSNFAVVSSGKTRVSNTRICNNSNHTYVTSSPGGIFGFVFVIAGGTGTGIKHSGDTLWVENCDIGHNRAAGGAGICILSGTGFVNRSVIHHNMSDAGPALRNFGKLSVSNSIISNNSSNRYGTINLVAGSSTTITNSTIINNPVNTAFFQKTIYHGAHYDSAGSSAITLSNCVIKSVTAPLFASYTGSTGIDSVAYSCTSSPVPGTGNLTGDPMLIAPLSELDSSDLIVSHYTLSACSPCVNAGADSLCSDTLDLAGQLRKYNRIDMGALELKYDSSVIALWCSDIDSSSATVHWSRSVKPCATVVFIRDTVAGAPVPVPGTAYIANSTFGGGSIVDGWYCLYRGMDSTSSVTGLLPGTTYRVAVFNVILDSIYDTPALYNFTTPAALPLFKQVMNDTIDPGEANCYNATIALTVAGNGSRFRVASGGSATLISGQKIRLLPGTAVDPGGYLSAYISPDGPWCYQSKSRADIQPDNNPEMSEILKPAKPWTIRAWPNPVTGMLNVSWPPVDAGKPLSIKLFDIHSRRIFSTEVRSASQVACWMGDLPDGVYLIKAISEDSSGILRVIKK